jgi:hypothetical protein
MINFYLKYRKNAQNSIKKIKNGHKTLTDTSQKYIYRWQTGTSKDF